MTQLTAKEITELAAKALDSKKGQDIKALHTADLTSLAEYFVICTGMSRTQIRSLVDEVEYKLEGYNVKPIRCEGTDSGVWVLQDFGSVILHVFTVDARDFYNLEKLYQDTTERDISSLITED